MAAHSRRLSILSAAEINDLYGLPNFTQDERSLYFDLSARESAVVGQVRTASVAMHLILQLGYFKAKSQFFVYEQRAVLEDLDYIIGRYFPDRDLASIKPLSKPTRLEQQGIILKLFDYRLCDSAIRLQLENKAERIAMISTQPVYILRELLQYLANQRWVAPGYTSLQDMVSRVVVKERNRLTQKLNGAMTPAVKQQLDRVLQADDSVYRIGALKREPKDFTYKELRQEVDRRKFFQPLHAFAQTFLATAGISQESGKYYASLLKFYTVYKLQRMPEATARLYLLCFAYHRFRQINDNLVDAFLHLVDQYEQRAKLAAEAAMHKAIGEAAENLHAAGEVLGLFVDSSIPGDTPFAVVKEKAFSLLEPGHFAQVSDYMRKVSFDKTGFEWAYYSTLSHAFKRNLRHLFTDLEFAVRVDDAPLLEAVTFLQELLRQGKSPRQTNPATFPVAVIPKGLQRYLLAAVADGEKRLDADRYEFLIYRLLHHALEAGDVFVQDSTEFRRFEDDLISDARWVEKGAILREIGSSILLAPIKDTLAAFKATLETQFKSVNQRIKEGLNRHIKVTGTGDKQRWTLIYPSEEEPTDSPFYDRLPGIGIADLLWFVASKTGFMGAFTHVLDRHVKQKADPREILACIVAMGTNMGLWKMAEVSGLSHASLAGASRNYLRLETVRDANDAITNATSALPAFHLYDIRDALHSSSDGQRMETQIDTINARYSPKYFGLQKGVSSYTLVANHVPINAKVIGAHEHESHYVFDLLYNNTSGIRPERHSTDTHGTNQVNFWILHAFGYQFAPRYRDLHKKMDTLVGFQQPGQYEDFLIKPSRKVYDDLIEKEWPNIQRIMASLAEKDATQATIVRKLGSYTRQNQTKKALWELENICRTIYILDFIDDVALRQCVQKALNRGEAYHRLRRAVAYVNGGKFRVKTEAEQQLWNECSRLITNAIIYYNTLLLSRVYEQKQAAGDQEAMAMIKGISPVAWQHVNLIGKFEFSTAESMVDIDALVAGYADQAFWNRASRNEPDGH
jgi:TnpA family transposase